MTGWGVVAVGLTAIVATVLSHKEAEGQWFAIWMGEAVIAAAIGFTTMYLKARRRFFTAWFAPIVGGAILRVCDREHMRTREACAYCFP